MDIFNYKNLRPSQRFLLQGAVGAAALLLYGVLSGQGLRLRMALTFLLFFPLFRYVIAWVLGRLD